MIADAPLWLLVLFAATTLLTGVLFYRSRPKHGIFILISIAWLALQGIVSYSGFYTVTDRFPPRFFLLVFPPLLFFVALFILPKGRAYIDSLDLKAIHWVHTVRIPVEICLLYIYYAGLIPELMTFEGRNFDILAGITAPLMIYLYFHRKSVGRKVMIAWNIISILLLVNIVVHAILSAPFPFQKLAFDQPNIGVFYFPFTWLPAYVVSLVFFSHFISLRQLLKKNQ